MIERSRSSSIASHHRGALRSTRGWAEPGGWLAPRPGERSSPVSPIVRGRRVRYKAFGRDPAAAALPPPGPRGGYMSVVPFRTAFLTPPRAPARVVRMLSGTRMRAIAQLDPDDERAYSTAVARVAPHV